jgi:hypothetical protein
MPNPGTISLPFGATSFLSCELVVELVELVEVLVEEPFCIVDTVDVDNWVVAVVVVISVIAGVCTVAISVVVLCTFMD